MSRTVSSISELRRAATTTFAPSWNKPRRRHGQYRFRHRSRVRPDLQDGEIETLGACFISVIVKNKIENGDTRSPHVFRAFCPNRRATVRRACEVEGLLSGMSEGRSGSRRADRRRIPLRLRTRVPLLERPSFAIETQHADRRGIE